VGNPNLVESHIDSVDLRWEWFFSPLELVSASVFYKEIDQPIEQVLLAQSSNVANSFANADSAELYGFEVEGRKHFGFIDPELEKLSFALNVAYIESDVTPAPAGQFEVQTQGNRPLQGQAPYVINAALEWADPDYGTARLLYNTAGASIAQIGQFGLPNIEQEPRNQLDFVYVNLFEIFGTPFTGKFVVENIWNDHYLFKQGDQVQSRYRTGLKLGLSLTYNF
jgi:outer membrane receptor protein involved in Fe transport